MIVYNYYVDVCSRYLGMKSAELSTEVKTYRPKATGPPTMFSANEAAKKRA